MPPFPSRHGGQYTNTARPITFCVGRKPQMCPSKLWLRLSPKTRTLPRGTTTGPNSYAASSAVKGSSCKSPLMKSFHASLRPRRPIRLNITNGTRGVQSPLVLAKTEENQPLLFDRCRVLTSIAMIRLIRASWLLASDWPY